MKQQLPRQQAETFALQERIGAQMSEIAALKKALTLILEVHPTKNTLDDYAYAVRYLAENALKATQ